MKHVNRFYLLLVLIVQICFSSCKENEDVPDAGPKSDDCELLSFSVAGNLNGLDKDLKFTYDGDTKTFSSMYLKWIDRDEPEMMIPNFETNGAKVLVNGNEVVSGKQNCLLPMIL